jgi:hypothetical protein
MSVFVVRLASERNIQQCMLFVRFDDSICFVFNRPECLFQSVERIEIGRTPQCPWKKRFVGVCPHAFALSSVFCEQCTTSTFLCRRKRLCLRMKDLLTRTKVEAFQRILIEDLSRIRIPIRDNGEFDNKCQIESLSVASKLLTIVKCIGTLACRWNARKRNRNDPTVTKKKKTNSLYSSKSNAINSIDSTHSLNVHMII